MNDRIKVNSASLSEWADQAEDIAATIRDALGALGSVDTSQQWWDSVGTIGPVSLKLAAQSVQLGTARAAVRGMGTALSASADATIRFAGQIRQAERNFTDAAATVDRRIDALLSGTGAPGGIGSAGAGGASGADTGAEAADGSSTTGWWNGKKDWSWWELIKSMLGKVGPIGTITAETIDMLMKAFKGQLDAWGIWKYLSKGGKGVAKWLDAWLHDKPVSEWFGIKPGSGSFGENFGKSFGNWINIIFAGFTTGVDNAKEYSDGDISADRAVVEWGTEWLAELGKTAGISAGGVALATAVLGTNPAGWAVLAGTAVVAGGYCVVDWIWKNTLGDGRSIVQSAGHAVGELYDNVKEGIKKAGTAVAETVSSWWSAVFG